MESPSIDLQHSKNPVDFTVPIDSNREAFFARDVNESPELRPQFRATSSQVRADSTSGDYSPHDEVQLTENPSKMDGGIAGGENSSEKRTQIAGVYEKSGKGNQSPPMDIHLSDTSSNLNEGNTNKKQSIQAAESIMNLNKGTSRNVQDTDRNDSFTASFAGYNSQLSVILPAGASTMHEEANLMQKIKLNELQANDQNTKRQASENLSEEDQSSNFSFGIKGNSMNITPILIPCVMQDTNQDKTMEKSGHDQQQINEQTSQSHQSKGKEVQTGKPTNKNIIQTDATNTKAHLHNVVNEKISRTAEPLKQVSNHGHKDKEGQKEQNKDTNQQGGTSELHQDNNKANMEYQNNFPRISNNYARYDPNLQRSRNIDNQVNNNVAQSNVKHPNNQQQGQAQNNTKQDIVPEPAPFTIVQSFAARLRYNQSKNETTIVLNSPVHTTRQGLPAVLLEEDDYNVKLVESCKHTLVGKFTNTMPKMEMIRKSFTLQTQLTGGVKIAHYNSRHVYIDLDNEFDYVTVGLNKG
ncbi:hypothetical protein KY284_030077 [Solanum tuberosum]|nr:hypothetical protein KY284_030077 [Solanum tuberosum]